MYTDIDSLKPLTRAGARIVTTHGDFKPENTLQLSDGDSSYVDRICVDFEFTCVTHAVVDLGNMLALFDESALELKRAFLKSYLEVLGESADEVDALMVDCNLALLASWQKGGMLTPWSFYGLNYQKIIEKIESCAAIATELRTSSGLQVLVKEKGLSHAIKQT